MSACPTMLVQNKASKSKDTFVINVSDFNADIHKKVMVKKEVEADSAPDPEQDPEQDPEPEENKTAGASAKK